MKKYFKKYNYTWLDLLVDLTLSFLIGVGAIVGVGLLFILGTALLPLSIVIFIGWLIILIFKAINKK